MYTPTKAELVRWGRMDPSALNRAVGPLRVITSRSVRLRRGRGTYTAEQLACGHEYKTDATGAVRNAKRRRCRSCRDLLNAAARGS